MLAFTLGSWVLDFAAAGKGSWLKDLSALSLTTILRTFERGIFSLGTVLGVLAAIVGLIALAAIVLPPGRTVSRKIAFAFMTVVLTAVVFGVVTQAHFTADMTENRRNSFAPADATALQKLHKRLVVIVRMVPEDPRYIDFERDVLGKLRRTVPDIEVVIAAPGRSRLFAGSADDYGTILYRYAGREAMSRSTGAGEVLPLIYGLAHIRRAALPEAPVDPGYPLVADAQPAGLWFYDALPLLVLLAWMVHEGFPRRIMDVWNHARNL